MDRYQITFNRLQEKKEGALVPFVVIGDPNLEKSIQVIDTLIESGADALELGFPFSDPLADGPTIQKATLRALDSGVTPDKCFSLITKVRQKHPQIPIGLLMYANLVFKNGINNFYFKAKTAGVDSVLIADVPTIEANLFINSAIKNGIKPIFIAPPNASSKTLKEIANICQGYTYLLSRSGVTGINNKVNHLIDDTIKQLNDFNAPPILQGFGISRPNQVKQAINAGAKGVISGSAVINIIETNIDNFSVMKNKLQEFISQLKISTKY